MNNTIQLLNKAGELEKKAYVDFASNFTKAGIVGLVQGGKSFEEATGLMKQACEANVKLIGLTANIAAFEKAAEYIAELEAKVEELTKQASEVKTSVEIIDEDSPLSKLASAGFSKEEIEMMASLPENLIQKVASTNTQPWDMGGGVGTAREKTDPFLEFLLG